MKATTGERALWRAVICMALSDATGEIDDLSPTVSSRAADGTRRRVPNPAVGHAVARARHWFEHGGADFRRVCAYADLDPAAVRDVALGRIGAQAAGGDSSPVVSAGAGPDSRPCREIL